MDAAVKHCTEGIGIWQWASNDQGVAPDVVMACCGDVPTLETLAGRIHFARHCPPEDPGGERRRPHEAGAAHEHPHGLSDTDFDELFTKDKHVIFGLPCLPMADPPADLSPHQPRQLPCPRLQGGGHHHNALRHDGAERNGSLFILVMDTIDRLPQTGEKGHLPEAAAQGQAGRTQAVHRPER